MSQTLGGTAQTYVICQLAASLIAIATQEVESIIKPQAYSVLPKARWGIKGLINVRGEALALLKLEDMWSMKRQDLHLAPDEEQKKLVICKSAQHRFCFEVDRVHKMTHIDAGAQESLSDQEISTGKLQQNYVKLGDDIVLILDLTSLLKALGATLAPEHGKAYGT